MLEAASFFFSAPSMSDALIITSCFSVYKNLDCLSAHSAVLNFLHQKQIILKTAGSIFFPLCILFLWSSAKHLSSTVRAAAAGFECGSPAVLTEQNAAQ